MPARTLLLLTYHFPPSGAVAVYRMLGFVRYLPRFGWNVAVIAPPNMPGEPQDPALLRLLPPETEVVRVPFPDGFLGKVSRRLLGNAAWLPAVIQECARHIPRWRPDAFLTSSPPGTIHSLGWYLKTHYELPWVASLRDPWFSNRPAPREWPYRLLDQVCEQRMVRRADAVVANTPLNLSGLRAAYPAFAAKMTTIPNGFEPDLFPITPEREGPPAALTLLHAGELYSGRDPRPLLDALARLQGEGHSGKPAWQVHFLGRATEGLCDIPAETTKRNLQDQIVLLPQAPYAEALRRMVSAEALLLLHTPGTRVGVPAKLYEYLGAGRPILALAEPGGDIDWVLRQSGVLYRIAPPEDVEAIRLALHELRAAILQGMDRLATPPHSSPFTRERMAQRMARCLDWVVGPRRGPAPQMFPDEGIPR